MTRYVELMRKCPLRPITKEKQNDRAIKVIEGLLDQPRMNKAEKDYLEVLTLLVHDFEETAYPIGRSTPQEMLQYLMENSGKSQNQIAKETGIQASSLCSMLKGKRQMGIKTIDKLARYFKISPAVFHAA